MSKGLLKNKLYGIITILVGFAGLAVCDGDVSFSIFAWGIGALLLVSKENWIY